MIEDESTSDSGETPTLTQAAERARLARIAREAAALRANLQRRKGQARALAARDAARNAPGREED